MGVCRYAVDEDQASNQHIATPHGDTTLQSDTPLQSNSADDRLAARLKQIMITPGISDKDRKLVERNLSRLLEAQKLRKKHAEDLA
jgi:hypothetical protein